MPELVETVDVAAPPEQVFAALVDWTTQGQWMLLTDVVTVDGAAQGVGGRIEARTGLPLPGGRRLGVLDRMTITGWEPPSVVDVRHPAGWCGAPAASRSASGTAVPPSCGWRPWSCRWARWAGWAGRW